MKKILAVCLVLAALLSLSACRENAETTVDPVKEYGSSVLNVYN